MDDNSRQSRLPRFFHGGRQPPLPLCHAVLSLLSCIFYGLMLATAPRASAATVANTPHFVLTSPTVQTGATIPKADVGTRNGCTGGDQSPPLIWNDGPAGTGSYAISMADLDARVGVTWLWMMFNIPASVTTLSQNAAEDEKLRPAETVQARNGFGNAGYTGPCPRPGKLAHHYLITVWALKDRTLPFKEGTPAEKVAIFLRRNALGHANLTPHYGGAR